MNILIIEDEFALADVIRESLLEEKYNVDISTDGLKGYNMLCNKLYDLIILDVMLPNMDWFEILKRIRNIDIFILKNNEVRARCYSINLEDMNISKINNTDVKIMVNGNNYIAIFSYNNINYDIETNGISKEEFINLLNSIIK